MKPYLADRVQQAFDRCKVFPEAGTQGGMFMVRGDAYLALIELRNMAPEIVLALERVTKDTEEVAEGSKPHRDG